VNQPARSPVTALVERFLPELKYPYLFLALTGLLLVDLVVPDPIPLVDEVALAMLTFLVARWRNREDATRPPKDVTPPDPRLPSDTTPG
jgi:hypothetical protein